MITLLEVLEKSTDFLEQKGVQDARLSAEWIMAESLGLKRLDLYLQFERPLKEEELGGIREGIRRRSKREPLQYILGNVEFYGVTLKTDARALIPRPETEYLIELLHTKYLNREPSRILDLGTGTGAIAIAMLHTFPDAEAVAVDRSEEALRLASENAEAVGVSDRLSLSQSDWFENVTGEFEVIISNPPYLTDEEMQSAEPEVSQYEPTQALHAGKDGLNDLSQIVDESLGYLVDGGVLALETGIAQHDNLITQAKGQGFTSMESIKDLARLPRYLIGLR
ncbi:peptide chain release factor N(5)-glutamine methyltransferase [Opitutia bacterium ISCC 51]|nr:peptide chain release factor N(5)-glutamine methyltransferase [Opitutae bacterium ISCC 51]QXD28356.1 peptide chain release factor N(5)-glutamine methyltransferase [Opitutae bacterium ISCC 52]